MLIWSFTKLREKAKADVKKIKKNSNLKLKFYDGEIDVKVVSEG